jgi:hypothetical protein
MPRLDSGKPTLINAVIDPAAGSESPAASATSIRKALSRRNNSSHLARNRHGKEIQEKNRSENPKAKTAKKPAARKAAKKPAKKANGIPSP